MKEQKGYRMSISQREKTNQDVLVRDYDGKFRTQHQIDDDIKKIHRPLTDKENELIEQFIKKQKEKENEIRSR